MLKMSQGCCSKNNLVVDMFSCGQLVYYIDWLHLKGLYWLWIVQEFILIMYSLRVCIYSNNLFET